MKTENAEATMGGPTTEKDISPPLRPIKGAGSKIIGIIPILTVLFTLGCLLVVRKGEIRDIWILLGVCAMLLLLLSGQRGPTVFLAILIIGTLVTREEFILGLEALFKGEHLASFYPMISSNNVQLVQQKVITNWVSDKVSIGDIEEKIIKLDATKLSVSSEIVLRSFSSGSKIRLSDIQKLRASGISLNIAREDMRRQLVAPGYVHMLPDETDAITLTESGKDLMADLKAIENTGN